MRPGPRTLAPVSTAAAWYLHQEPLSLLGLATAIALKASPAGHNERA